MEGKSTPTAAPKTRTDEPDPPKSPLSYPVEGEARTRDDEPLPPKSPASYNTEGK
jgi:hypothetical protein